MERLWPVVAARLREWNREEEERVIVIPGLRQGAHSAMTIATLRLYKPPELRLRPWGCICP